MEPDVFPPQALRVAPLAEQPLSIPRLGAAVDALIRPRAKGKPPRPLDPPALFVLFFIFLAIFLALIAVLRSFFPAALVSARHANMRHLQDNLRRVEHNLPPRQYWPLPESKQRSLQPTPRPIRSNVTVDRVWATRFLSDRRLAPTLRISLVAACKDRTAFLQTALPQWLHVLHPRLDEIVLVDWATSPPDFVPVAEVVHATDDARVAVVSLTHPSPWALSRAYNLGFALARGEWILKLDCDTALANHFLTEHRLPTGDEKSFYRFDWRLARDKNEQHLNGIFLARTAHIRAIHGYDERITTYGWEDSDFYTRLEKGYDGIASPLEAVPINRDTVRHMAHDDSLRDADHHLRMGPVMQTQINSQAAEGIDSWTAVGGNEKTHFQLDVMSRDARFLTAKVLTAPLTLLERLEPTRQKEIVSESTIRVLHDVYDVPWSVMAEMDRSREEVVRVLASLGQIANWGSGEGVIFTILQGGVAERIVGLASSLWFANAHRRALFMTWGDGCTANSKEDVTACRTTEFFNLDDSRRAAFSADHDPSKIAPTIQVSCWKCRDRIAECGEEDKAYKRLSVHDGRVGGELTDGNVRTMLDVLQGKVEGKRNILVKLHGAFPLPTEDQLRSAISLLRLSTAVQQYIAQLGDVSDHIGVYIGPSVKWKYVETMAKTMMRDYYNESSTAFFVTGTNRDVVENARRLLPPSPSVATALNNSINIAASSEQARETIRQIGDLYALATCKVTPNDGRPSSSTRQLIDALTYHHHRKQLRKQSE